MGGGGIKYIITFYGNIIGKTLNALFFSFVLVEVEMRIAIFFFFFCVNLTWTI